MHLSTSRTRIWYNFMPNKQGYLARLQTTIQQLHNCGAVHLQTVQVHEEFHGRTIWKGDVEVFDLTGHPKAKRCYGWSYGDPEEFITILKLPPIESAQDAVKVGVSQQKKVKKETWSQ